jgi:hypothetical protein
MVETDQLGTAICRDRSSLLMVLVRPQIGNSGVEQAALDRPVTQVILDEVDRLAGIEKVSGDGVTHEVNVAVGRRQVGKNGVAREQSLTQCLIRRPRPRSRTGTTAQSTTSVNRPGFCGGSRR